MSKPKRMLWFGMLDSIIVFTASYISILLMFPSSPVFSEQMYLLSAILVGSHLSFAAYYKIYVRAWEYASVEEVMVLVKSVTFSVIVAASLQFLLAADVYFRVLASTWMLQVLFICASRYSMRLYHDRKHKPLNEGKRTLIIGAGTAGTLVARQLGQKGDCDLKPVAFLDDDLRKHHLHIFNIPVVGGIGDLADQVKDLNIEQIIIAIPSLSKKESKVIHAACLATGVETRMVPMYEDLVTGRLRFDEMKKVDVHHLLGRPPVDLETQSMAEMIEGCTVLVTGAGGSIGSEICRQVAKFHPSTVILLGHGENSIYTIHREMIKNAGQEIQWHTEIADIKDRDRMIEIMSSYQPDVVIHAAAHKHVPLMEKNPVEAITNNIFGTKHVAEAADLCGVHTFVMISSDKAVNPTSVMGATKRIAEMVIQDLDKKSSTRFVAVRFGNVLGSRGSVIPHFLDQIKEGGPVTVTDPAMTRYFMTIPEASRLVLQAGALARGGEVFVLDMGEPVKIIDLARNLIQLSGFTEKEIGIQFTGVRPGEKLYEELLNENEVHDKAVHPRIYVGKTVEFDLNEVLQRVEDAVSKGRDFQREVLLSVATRPTSAVAAV